jgi:hypothetical protein
MQINISIVLAPLDSHPASATGAEITLLRQHTQGTSLGMAVNQLT